MPTKSFSVLVILLSLFNTAVQADNISLALASPASGEDWD
jgi:hypothetical protein